MSSSFSDQPRPGTTRPNEEDPGYSDRPAPRPTAPPPPGLPALGSLAQKARGKQLNQARTLLIVVGVLTILVNAGMMLTVRSQVTGEIDKELAKNGVNRSMADPTKLKEIEETAIFMGFVITGVAVGLGVLFLIFGLIVKKFPVPVTVTSLVLYIAAAIGFGILDPTTLASGIIMKIIFVVCFVKAIQAALAYEREAREEAAAQEMAGEQGF